MINIDVRGMAEVQQVPNGAGGGSRNADNEK